jgi:acetyl-CoA acetyltransferase
MDEPVWIVGVGMTPFGLHQGRTAADLAQEAVGEALADAGLAMRDVGAAGHPGEQRRHCRAASWRDHSPASMSAEM